MKLPVLWLAAALAAGIALARHSHFFVAECGVAAAGSLLIAAIFLWRKHAAIAWTIALVAWAATGATAACVQAARVDPYHVEQLIAQNRLDPSSPLR